MSRANRLTRLVGAAALGLAAIWSMTSKPAVAQTDPPPPSLPHPDCNYDESTGLYHDAKGNECSVCLYDQSGGGFRDQHGRECRTALGYRWGTYFGYVSARSAVLRKVGDQRYPVWAEYAEDRYIEDFSQKDDEGRPIKVFLPGAPEEIAVATEAYENAKVLGADEVAFAAQAFVQLKRDYTNPETEPGPRERYEIVTRTYYESSSTRFYDSGNVAVEPKPRLGVNTTHVMVLRKEYVPPQGRFIIQEFPLDPRQAEEALAGNVPRVQGRPVVEAGKLKSFLVATRTEEIGKVLVAGDGVITYLAGFGEAMSDDEANANGIRGGTCADNAALEAKIDGKVYTSWDDYFHFQDCDAWRLKSVWGGMVGARVDTGSRWMMDRFMPVQTRYQRAGNWVNANGTEEPREFIGRFDLQYPYPAGSQFWDTLFVSMAFAPFDPRVPFGSRFITRRRVQGGATLETNPGFISALGASFSGRGFGNGLGGYSIGNPFTLATDGALIDTQKPRSINVPIELAYMKGEVALANIPRLPQVPMPDRRIILIDDSEKVPPNNPSDAEAPYFDGKTSYGHIHDRQPNRTDVRIDLRTGQETNAGSGVPSSGSGEGGEAGTIPFIRRYQVSRDLDAASNQGGAGPLDADATLAGQLSPDGTPSPIYDSDLVHDITRADFANTDVHVFGPSGDLVSSRIGLRQNESPGLECDPPVQPLVMLGDAGHPGAAAASADCRIPEENANREAAAPIQDFIRNRYPGSRYKVAFVNRSTGYIGTGFVRVGGPRGSAGASDGTGGRASDSDLFARLGPKDFVSAYEIESGDGSPIIFMRPPNLTIRVTRTRQDVKAIVGDDTPVQQIVGFEGGGLVDDTQVVITTDWFDHDGSPLPDSLPGYTGRLTRVIDEEGTLGQVEGTGAVGHFTIRPGRNIAVLKLPEKVPAHYYVHVSGANADRCGGEEQQLADPDLPDGLRWFQSHSPACASFAQEIDEEFGKQKDRRPDRYVPVLVPIFDAAATRDAAELQIGLARERAQAKFAAGEKLTAEDLRLPKTQAIYTNVYRAEAQFTLYELSEFESPELVTRFDKDKGRGRTTLSFGYELGDSGFDPLTPYGSSKDEVWGLGFEELVAMVNDDNAKAEFDDLERILLLSPAQQLQEVQGVVDGLTPEDYLALQLYLANDRGNALYTDHDVPYPLVSVDVAPIELQRRENLTRFGPGVVPAPPVEDGFAPIRFDVTRPACLTIKATPRETSVGPATSVELVAQTQLVPNTYYYVLDGGELFDKGVKGNFTLEFFAETCGPAVDAGSDGISAFKVHRSEIEVTQETLRSNRGIGEIVEHDVNVLDGSLRLSRQDFSIGGKGPALALMRSYSNLGTDSDGALGNGWSHSFDLQLVPTSTEETSNQSVPAWVFELRSKVTPCPNGQCVVTQKLFPSEPIQLTGVYVNGTTFRNIGQQQWAAESGRHGELIQHCSPESPSPECFEFKSKDGTSYYYDYPEAKAAVAGQADPDPTMLSLSDGLAERLALFDLRFRQANVQQGQGASGMEPTLVKRIKDRFDYELRIDADDEGRVENVVEADRGTPSGRACRFIYDAGGADAPADCEHAAKDFDRLRSIVCLENQQSALSGPLEIKVDYCYDEDGNLASVERGRHLERYEYEHEGGASPDGAEEAGNPNLVATVVENDSAEQRTTYRYRPDVAPHTFASGALPAPIASFDMVEAVTYPPTEPMPRAEAEAEVTFHYDGMTRTVSDPRGAPHEGRRYTVNTLGNPTQIVEAGRKTTTMQWSFDVGSSACGPTSPGDNQMVSRTVELEEGRSVTTTFAYDAAGNVTGECTQIGSATLATRQEWNEFGQLERRTDFRGVEEDWEYDDRGLVELYINGAGVRTEYTPSTEHRARPATETVVGDVTQTTAYHYDAFGNVASSSIVGVAGTSKSSQYDARSRLERQSDQLGRETTYEYDINDNLRFTRLPAVSHPADAHVVETIEATYDAVGNKKTENDRNGLKLTYQYTARNQVKQVTRTTVGANAGDHSRYFKYDLLGNIRSETDWKGAASEYEYDLLGFREKTFDREGKLTTTLRDYAGNVVLLTDAGAPPLTTRVWYDGLNREVSRKPQCGEPDCGEITTAYPTAPDVTGDGVVYSVSVTGPGSTTGARVTTRSGYDGRGLMVVKVDAFSHRFEWTYDALGRLKRTKNEEGIITTQSYDSRGFLASRRLRGRSETNPGLLSEFTADNAGNVLFTTVYRDASHTLVTGATYDGWNRAVTRTAPGSPTEQLDYDGEGNVVRHQDAGGRVRTWERDQRGNVVHFYDAEVKSRTAGQASTPQDKDFTLHYEVIDANDNPERVVNALGMATVYQYDSEERVESITEAQGGPDARTREFRDFDGLGNPREVTDWRGNATTLAYTARHNIFTETDPLQRVTTYSYDGQGNQASIKSPRNFVRTFKRDDLGRVKDVYYPDATTLEAHNDYDKVGNITAIRNRRNSATHFEYDPYLRVEHVRKILGGAGTLTRIQTNEYDDAGNVTAVIDGNGNRTVYEFNDRNLLWKTILPAVAGEPEAERTEVREYSASGALLSVTAPHASGEPAFVTTYAHDKEDRSISVTATGETTTSSYDLLGNLRAQTTPEGQPGGKFSGKSKRFSYDDLQRVDRVTDEVGLTTKYGYDKAGNLRDVEGPFDVSPNADTPHIGYTYNPQVDRLEEHLQYRKTGGALVTRYDGFDDHDNVTHLTDANGNGFTYNYDEYDRRTAAFYPNKPSALNEPKRIDWDFDDDANTVTIIETKKGPSGAELQDMTLERYDLLFDRLASRTQRGHEVSYGYDVNGNRTRVTSPQGVTTYTFDARNRVETAVIAGATSTYQYHQDSRVRSIERPNGTTTSLTYYSTRRVHQITHQFAGGESAIVAYTYDKNGNRTSAGDTRNGLPDVTSFDEYDAANRLVEFTQDDRTTRYGYERYNRKTEHVEENGLTQVNKTYAHDELERLKSVVDDAQAPITVSYNYDDNGNTLTRAVSTAPADRTDFEYNSRDQLVRVTRGPPGSEQVLGRYDYDSEGKRTRHEDSERGSAEYLYDDDAVIEERLSASSGPPNTRVTRYHYGQELLAIAENAGTRYYHQDGLGSTTQLSDSAGVTTVEYKTDPFGNVRLNEGDTDNRTTFTGQEYDERTGLYYYGARYYDPVIGQFLTQDSYLGESGTPASLHRYLYAYSNPLSYVDPTGHHPALVAAAAVLAFAGSFFLPQIANAPREEVRKTDGTMGPEEIVARRSQLEIAGNGVAAGASVAFPAAMASRLGLSGIAAWIYEGVGGATYLKAYEDVTTGHHSTAGEYVENGILGGVLAVGTGAASRVASKAWTEIRNLVRGSTAEALEQGAKGITVEVPNGRVPGAEAHPTTRIELEPPPTGQTVLPKPTSRAPLVVEEGANLVPEQAHALQRPRPLAPPEAQPFQARADEILAQTRARLGNPRTEVLNQGSTTTPIGAGAAEGGFQSVAPSRRTFSQSTPEGTRVAEPLYPDSPYVTRVDPRAPGRPDPRFSVDSSTFSAGELTSGGGVRNAQQFWEQWASMRPESLSASNQFLIENFARLKVSPRVDPTWVRAFPEHAPFAQDVLVHHHVDFGRYAIPVPGRTHVGSGGPWHTK